MVFTKFITLSIFLSRTSSNPDFVITSIEKLLEVKAMILLLSLLFLCNLTISNPSLA